QSRTRHTLFMTGPDDTSVRIARELLRIGAVTFSPEDLFTWASGIQSPVYVDNRLTIGYPDVRKSITDGFVSLMESHRIEVGAVVGTATAGIPHAAWLADRLDLPMAYVRGSAKRHGHRHKVEGFVEKDSSVVVVEDLVSTGGSSLDVVDTLRDAGARVIAVMAIFTYGMKRAVGAFRDADVTLHCLTDFNTVLEVALADGTLQAGDEATIREWHGRLVTARPDAE
ncbi:MAG: orotate phosphoribosyltransferase, partial [Synechococcaceae cyanobacterium]|nr:orotate phosphoribosyltransferase [Synechococcaceae cyanobacterium]